MGGGFTSRPPSFGYRATLFGPPLGQGRTVTEAGRKVPVEGDGSVTFRFAEPAPAVLAGRASSSRSFRGRTGAGAGASICYWGGRDGFPVQDLPSSESTTQQPRKCSPGWR